MIQQTPDTLSSQALIGIGIIAFILFSLMYYIPRIFFILSLSKTMRHVPKQFHVFPQWFLWMLLIPFVEFVFSWIMLPFGIPYAMQAAVPDNPEALRKSKVIFGLGLSLMITISFFIIPYLNLLAMIGAFVLWIIYWVEVVNFRRYLNSSELPMPKIVDKSSMPTALNFASWLVLILSLIFVSLLIYNGIKLAPIYTEMFKAAHPEIHFDFAPYILAISGIIESIVVVVFSIIMFNGLRNAKRGIYILTLVSCGIGLFFSIFGLLASMLMVDFYKQLPSSIMPAHALQALNSVEIANRPMLYIQLGLLVILLILLLTKKARAWFQ